MKANAFCITVAIMSVNDRVKVIVQHPAKADLRDYNKPRLTEFVVDMGSVINTAVNSFLDGKGWPKDEQEDDD